MLALGLDYGVTSPFGNYASTALEIWRRHQMETFSALLALCARKSPVTGEKSPHKGQWRGALMLSLICTLNKRLIKQLWGWRFDTSSCSLWRHCNEMLCSGWHSGEGQNPPQIVEPWSWILRWWVKCPLDWNIFFHKKIDCFLQIRMHAVASAQSVLQMLICKWIEIDTLYISPQPVCKTWGNTYLGLEA